MFRSMIKKSLVLALAALTLGSCQKLDEFTKFNMPIEQLVEIPVIPTSGNAIQIPVAAFETGIDSALSANASNMDLIQDVFLESFVIEVVDPANSNLDYLESIEFKLSSPTSVEMKSAWKDPVPEGTGNRLELDVWDVDMKRLFFSNVLNVKLDIANDKSTENTQMVRMKLNFKVNVKILGV